MESKSFSADTKTASHKEQRMITKRLVLHFPATLLDRPIIYQLVKNYDLMFNILKARITPEKEGSIILEFTGTEENFEAGMNFLKQLNIQTESLVSELVRNEAKCIHCGVCTISCPTKSLNIDRSSMKIEFNEELCIACEACVKICPTRAIVVNF